MSYPEAKLTQDETRLVGVALQAARDHIRRARENVAIEQMEKAAGGNLGGHRGEHGIVEHDSRLDPKRVEEYRKLAALEDKLTAAYGLLQTKEENEPSR